MSSEKRNEVSFSSYPEGARVIVNGKDMCAATPCVVKVNNQHGSDINVVIEKEGYKSVARTVSSVINPWILGNFVFGGAIGTTSDAVSGAMFKYKENHIHVELKKN